MTELYWGLRSKSYVRTRGWSDAELDAGISDLESRGLIESGGLTERGRQEREAIETRTDEQCAPVLDVPSVTTSRRRSPSYGGSPTPFVKRTAIPPQVLTTLRRYMPSSDSISPRAK